MLKPLPFAVKKTPQILSALLLGILLSAGQAVSGPSDAYFQQYVRYRIDAELLPDEHSVRARQTLLYVNHSPDTLRSMFFHLYYNKFKSGSYYRPYNRAELASINIDWLRDRNGDSLAYVLDNTLLTVQLKQPLLPGDTLVLDFGFVSVLPRSQSRFGYSGDHFDVGNWYPVPAVYDKFGWHIEQHLDGEFYQEWGDYQVNITVPRDFVVGATGVLLNPEVLPDSVEFVGRSTRYHQSGVLDTVRVTYRFEAKNVHDFAWAANPDFVRIRRQVGPVTLDFLILSYRYADWNTIVDDATNAFRFFQEQIGPYPYPRMTVVDGFITAGGIEYPNIVIINDYITNLRYLAITVIHEIAHQWFYGLLANNQTRYGWMDEGFTTFYEILATEHLWGTQNNLNYGHRGFWQKLQSYQRNARHSSTLNYLEYALGGNEEPINLRFDYFTQSPYIPYYDKTAVVLFTLKAMVGDSLFNKAIRQYYDSWRFKHPYPEDMYFAFEKATAMNLDWFWDEWLNTTWTCDYAIRKIAGKWRFNEQGRIYEARILLERKQSIAMPVPIRLTLKNGKSLNYLIPVTEWNPEYSPENSLKPWSPANRMYLLKLNLPDEISRAIVDPNYTLPDRNFFNNDNRLLPPVRFYWLHRQYLEPGTTSYTTTLFPFFFYNSVDGVQLGLRTVGNYIYPYYQHTSQLLVGHKTARPAIHLDWESPLLKNNSTLHYYWKVFHDAGRWGGELSANNSGRSRNQHLRWKTGWRFVKLFDSRYLYYPWSTGQVSTFFLNLSHSKRLARNRERGYTLSLQGETSLFSSDYQFRQIRANLRLQTYWLRYRLFQISLRAGLSQGNVPLQNLFYLAQASPVKLFQNPYSRAVGTIPERLLRNGHFMVPGGGDIRSSLTSPVAVATSGKNLLAGSLRAEIWNPAEMLSFDIPIVTFLSYSVFTNWAVVWNNRLRLNQIVGEAGVSVTYEQLPVWMRYFHLDKIHLDFPLWLNRPAAGGPSFKFRWNLRLDVESFM